MRVTSPERTDAGSTVGIAYNAFGAVPHALTQEASYTVPAGKRVRIDSASISLLMYSLPTLGGLVQAYITDGARDIVGLYWQYNETGNQAPSVAIGFAGYAGPGTPLSIYTADASTGGSMGYRINLRLALIT